jgi:hypothetical protein
MADFLAFAQFHASPHSAPVEVSSSKPAEIFLDEK